MLDELLHIVSLDELVEGEAIDRARLLSPAPRIVHYKEVVKRLT